MPRHGQEMRPAMNASCSLCPRQIKIERLSVKTEIGEFANYTEDHRLYPSETDLINLTYLEYEINPKDSCVHTCASRLRANDTKCCQYLRTKKWVLVESFGQSGQNSATFYNVRSNHLVIVHRGTGTLQSGKADLNEVVAQIFGPFGNRAYLYTKYAVEKYGSGALSITVTGHSLGGLSSQVATFFMKYPEYFEEAYPHGLASDWKQEIEEHVKLYSHNSQLSLNGADLGRLCQDSYHLHCVSFDGPGCNELVKKLFPKYDDDRGLTFRIFDSLDIHVYLASVNSVNIVNEQIGSVFQMKLNRFQTQESDLNSSNERMLKSLKSFFIPESIKQWFSRIIGSHSCADMGEFWSKYSRGSNEVQVLKVVDWLTAESCWDYTKKLFKTQVKVQERDLLMLRMSCFDAHERQTIERLAVCKEFYANSELPIWTTLSKVRYLTHGFTTEHNYQVLQIHKPSALESGRIELYRDYFVRRMKCMLEEFRRVEISAELPSFMETEYISRTAEYIKTILNFIDEKSSDVLVDLKGRFSLPGQQLIFVQAPVPGVRICLRSFYHTREV